MYEKPLFIVEMKQNTTSGIMKHFEFAKKSEAKDKFKELKRGYKTTVVMHRNGKLIAEAKS
jgi:hypothetical protein